VSTTPTLSWLAASQAVSYTLQVASDPGFATIVYSATVTGTSHTIGVNLAGNTTYYWRVRSQNGCGTSAFSAVSSFRTKAVYCRTPNLAIPDGNASGISDTLTITDTRLLADLDVSVKANQTYVGDLVFSLLHIDTGTSVTLIDRPGVPASTFGCSGDNIDATLDDAASAAVEEQCAGGVPTIAGTFRPNNPLSAFAGQSLNGAWQLTASDRATPDAGTLVEWCLIPTLNTNVYLPIVIKN
jgi:subtilisin-like proprotein convertase family protein